MMNNSLNENQIKRLHHILDAVSSRIVAFYMQEDANARDKSDGTPLTDADLASSAFLIANLPSVLDVPIVCEETFTGAAEYLNMETYWLVDPIDGTKGFIQKNGQFCVCVALIHQHKSILGAIYEPLTQTCWLAKDGQLRKWVNGHEIKITPIHFEAPFVFATGNGQLSPRMQAYQETQQLGEFVHLNKGSALKFTDVVDGYVDLYVKMSKTAEWDTAAGQVIVESIGGKVLDCRGETLRYGMRETIINPPFVVCSPSMTDEQVQHAWQHLPKS